MSAKHTIDAVMSANGAAGWTGARGVNWLRRARISLALALAVVLAVSTASTAAGAWRLDAVSNPTAAPGSQVRYVVQAMNVGDTPLPATVGGDSTNCEPGAPPPADPAKCYSIRATFPVEMTPVSATRVSGAVCTTELGTNSITCAIPGSVAPQQAGTQNISSIKQTIFVAAVQPDASGTLTSTFEVNGPEGRSVTTVDSTVIDPALPKFGIGEFDGQVAADEAGAPLTQAGGHPHEASTSIEFYSIDHPNPFFGPLWPVEAPKTVVVELPPGFVGSPAGVTKCTSADLAGNSGLEVRSLCAPTSQVGVVFVRLNPFGVGFLQGPIALYNMVPPPDGPARFGFNVFGTVVTLDAEVRSEDDYGVSIVNNNVPQGVGVQGVAVKLWGDPSHPSHDVDRSCPGQLVPWLSGISCASGAPSRAFLRNPTACTPDRVGLPTTIRIDSWQHPGDFVSRSFESHLPPAYPAAPEDWGDPRGPENCDRVPFRPRLVGGPAAGSRAGEPAGFNFDLLLPQTDDPLAIATGDLRKAVVALPTHARLSPSSARGLAGCKPDEIGLNIRGPPSCPGASKVGSLTIETPLLDEPLDGAVYLATPFDNPFDSLIAIYLVAEGPGFTVKIPGHVSPDPFKDGQLTATFDNSPQTPFSKVHLEFKGGPRAPIVLPKRCGTYTTHAELTSWSGATVSSDSSFTVSEGCGGGFTPTFAAGTESSAAGKSSPFLLRLSRDDTDEDLSGISLNMPRGLVGRIADVTLCGEGDAATGTCPDSSKVGSVTVGAGAGPSPFYITNGRAYLTGPYRGGPFGLSIVVPAVAGPFDLGLVVVRSAIFVDRHTAEVRVIADPLPTQLQGIPLSVKDVRVDVDRPGFWLNPTSCAEKSIAGTIVSTDGTKAGVSSRFQAYDCAALDLKPRMTLQVGGRGRTQRGRSTPFNATLRVPSGGANLRSVRVTLPTAINARLTVINDACTRAEYEAGNCEDARTGSATAVTPLLRDPLRGGVYFVRNGNPLPDLFVRLRGQVDFDLIGKITIPGSKRLRTTFDLVPDVPVSMFALRLVSGRDGSVGNATNLCSRRGRTARATLEFIGQNGKELDVAQRLKIRGCSQRAARGRRRGRRSARGR